MALNIAQQSFSLASALQQAASFDYNVENTDDDNQLSPVVSQFVQTLRKA